MRDITIISIVVGVVVALLLFSLFATSALKKRRQRTALRSHARVVSDERSAEIATYVRYDSPEIGTPPRSPVYRDRMNPSRSRSPHLRTPPQSPGSPHLRTPPRSPGSPHLRTPPQSPGSPNLRTPPQSPSSPHLRTPPRSPDSPERNVHNIREQRHLMAEPLVSPSARRRLVFESQLSRHQPDVVASTLNSVRGNHRGQAGGLSSPELT